MAVPAITAAVSHFRLALADGSRKERLNAIAAMLNKIFFFIFLSFG